MGGFSKDHLLACCLADPERSEGKRAAPTISAGYSERSRTQQSGWKLVPTKKASYSKVGLHTSAGSSFLTKIKVVQEFVYWPRTPQWVPLHK